MESVLLARHGESEFNVLGTLNGDATAANPLTPRGVEQAGDLRRALRDQPLDLCVTSALERAQATADLALQGREVPRLVLPDLNDPLYGPFEGGRLEEYRAWASAVSSLEAPGDGGESRHEIVARYTRAFGTLLARPEATILVVCHSLPVAYALAARDGRMPAPRVGLVANAVAYPFTANELSSATDLLERWLAAPSW